jgi:hypothetical protein
MRFAAGSGLCLAQSSFLFVGIEQGVLFLIVKLIVECDEYNGGRN